MTLSKSAASSLFTCAALLCGVSATSAQTPVVPGYSAHRQAWHFEQLGPMPGAAPELRELVTSAADPDRIYCSSAAGVLASFDRGVNWELRSRNPGYAGFAYLDVSPTNADRLIRANLLGPLELSTDAGLTWHAPTTPPVGTSIRSPQFTLSDTVYVSTTWSIWKSVDGGDNFVEVLNDLQGGYCLYLRADPSDALHAYAPVAGVGLFETVDGGVNWILKPLPNDLLSLEVDPLDGNRLLLGYIGMQFSSDAGNSWVDISPPVVPTVDALAFDPSNPLRFYASFRQKGLAVTDDGGANWNLVTDSGLNTAGTLMWSILPSSVHAGQIVVGSNGGAFRSTNSGASFTRVNNGLESYASARALVVDPFDSTHLVAFTGGTAFYSHDEGATWTESSGITPMATYDVAADNAIPGRFYAGDWSVGFWRSDDGGHTFYEPYAGPRHFVKIATHPTVAGRIFGAGNGLQRSDDGGLTFSATSAPLGWSWAMAISSANPDIMYVSGVSKLLHSTDGGLNWKDATSKPIGIVRDIFADPLDPNRAYAVVPLEGLYRSDDHGVHWKLMSSAFESSSTVTVPDFDWNVLLGNAQLGNSTPISRNAGAFGLRLDAGLESTINDFANAPLRTFAGTAGQGVMVLRN